MYSRWSRNSSLVRGLTDQSPEGGEEAACLREDILGEDRDPGRACLAPGRMGMEWVEKTRKQGQRP